MLNTHIFSLNFAIISAVFSFGLLYYLSRTHSITESEKLNKILGLGIFGSFFIPLLSGLFIFSDLGRILARNVTDQMNLHYAPEVFIWPQIIALIFGTGAALWIENSEKELSRLDTPFKKVLGSYSVFLLTSFVMNITMTLLVTSFS